MLPDPSVHSLGHSADKNGASACSTSCVSLPLCLFLSHHVPLSAPSFPPVTGSVPRGCSKSTMSFCQWAEQRGTREQSPALYESLQEAAWEA